MKNRHRAGWLLNFLLLLMLSGWIGRSAAGEILVAVAANFAQPAAAVAQAFTRDSGHRVNFAAGATGSLYAQIRNGAPFDVLLAADDETPARLEAEGAAAAGSRYTYAIGRLALWLGASGPAGEPLDVLQNGTYRRLALANPKLAPYGRAAQQFMQRRGLWQQSQSRIVLGENITHAYVFVDSGNADLGFVALSQVRKPGLTPKGRYWVVPAQMHDPIRQDAVLLQHGENNAAARQWLHYLRSDKARSIIRQYGYE